MKKFVVIILAIQFCVTLKAQNRFEGIIRFKTEISVNDSAPEGFLRQLNNKYGDSLIIYYYSDGEILREYINTGENGNKYQLYQKGSKNLLLREEASTKTDSLDVSKNTLTLIKLSKSKKDTIIGVPCRCYVFEASNDYDQRTLTFCYSKKTPKIKKRYYKKYRDYFVSKFYKLSKRPYLSFSINARDFNLTFTAVELKEMPLDHKLFLE